MPAEASQFPGRWSNATAPYLVEIMDVCGPDHPAERVTIKKSAQVGYSEALTNIIGTMIDVAPGPAMVVHPTVESGKNWVAEKLDLTIAATPRLRSKVRQTISRDGTGSTAKRKRFPGGLMVVTGANSTRELRQRSIRYLYKDDWSDWPLDVDGQGDPDKMAEARTLGFQSSGQTKIVQGSTPTVKGICRVSAAYERSDRRVYLVPCPHCEWEQQLRFFPDEKGRGGLRFNRSAPFDAHYECEACGMSIEHAQKRSMVARGRWHATNETGTHPGFHISSLYSPFTTWERIVERFIESEGKPHEEKVFWNLDLGEPWEEKGDAPPWQDLQKRAEDYPLDRVPRGALVVTVGCDVQKAGIYYEIVAWGRGLESWSLGAEFLEGETSDRGSPVWSALDAVYRSRFAIDEGEPIGIDMLAIDANYNTDQVCDWVRGKPLAMAVRGVDGWDRVVFSTASKVDVNFRGERRKRSAKIWPLFVWSMKGELYAHLKKKPDQASGALPAGYCHFPASYPSGFYQQLTADQLKEVERKGKLRLEWTTVGQNHFHDCRIYARAAFARAAKQFGLQHDSIEAWDRLEARRRPGTPQRELVLDAASVNTAPAPAAAPVLKPRQAAAPQRLLSPMRRPSWVNKWKM